MVLLLWGDLFEDFHDTIDVSIEDFRAQLTGGWLFGSVVALDRVGVHVVMLQVSGRIAAPLRFVPEPAVPARGLPRRPH